MTPRSALAEPSIRRYLTLAVLLTLALGWAVGRASAPTQGLEVTFHNASETPIESIRLDFGSADAQSRIQAFRIAPGQQRLLVLNHPAGAGFNVNVRYQGGQEQEFCALRGDDRTRPSIYLKP